MTLSLVSVISLLGLAVALTVAVSAGVAIGRQGRRLDGLSRELRDLRTVITDAGHGTSTGSSDGADAGEQPPTAVTTSARPTAAVTPAVGLPEPLPPVPAVRERAGSDVEPDDDVSVITAMHRSPAEDLTTTRIASVALGGPLIKVAALSHGVRRALSEEQRMRIAHVMRKELRQQRKMRRRQRSQQAGSTRWTS